MNRQAAAGILAAACFVLMARQVATPGVFCCIIEDTGFTVNWARQFSVALAEGTLYPRWLPDSHAGFGNPTFVFYPPLMMYLTAAFGFVTGGTGVTAVKVLGLALSVLTMYRFAASEWGPRAGVVAALVYAAVPFRVYDLYFLGVFQSKLALAAFPLCLQGARDVARGRGVVGLAVGYALVVGTHLLSAYLIVPVVAIVVATSTPSGERLRALVRASGAGVLGLALAGVYFLPMALESPFVQLDSFAAKATFDFRNNFVFWVLTAPSELQPPFYPYLARTLFATAFTGLGLWALSRPWARSLEAVERAMLPVVIGVMFLLSSLSALVWRFVPGLAMVAFPSRWGVVLALAVAVLAGVGAARTRWTPARVAVALVLCAPSVWYDADVIRNGCVFGPADLAAIDPSYDVEEYVPKGVSLPWLREIEKAPRLPQVSSDAEVQVTAWEAHHRRVAVDARAPAAVWIRTFAFPEWRATLDGAPVAIRTEETTGAMIVDVPSGSHTLDLRFGPTAATWMGATASALAVGVLAIGQRRRWTWIASDGSSSGARA